MYLNDVLYGIICTGELHDIAHIIINIQVCLVTNIEPVYHTTWSTVKIVNMDHQTYQPMLMVHIDVFNEKFSISAPNNIEKHVRCLFSDKAH
jgi:hypothetical protein